MSMQRECGIVELEPGRWFCLVADREYGELDEGCTAYGPKSTAEGAWEAMADCESNPGGHWTYTWDSMDAATRREYAAVVKANRVRPMHRLW